MSSCHFKGKPKVRHATKEAAYDHLNEMQPHRLELMQVYRCPRCRFWHIGRRPGSKNGMWQIRQYQKIDERLVGQLIGVLSGILRHHKVNDLEPSDSVTTTDVH